MQVWLSQLSQLIPGYASLNISTRVILGYPNLQNLYRDIPGYPDLPRVSFFQMSCTNLYQRNRGLTVTRKVLALEFSGPGSDMLIFFLDAVNILFP